MIGHDLEYIDGITQDNDDDNDDDKDDVNNEYKDDDNADDNDDDKEVQDAGGSPCRGREVG